MSYKPYDLKNKTKVNFLTHTILCVSNCRIRNMSEHLYNILKERFLYNRVIFNIFRSRLVDITLSRVINIDTFPYSSSSNNINVGHFFFNDRSGLIIYQVGNSQSFAIFPLRDQLRAILDGMGIVSIQLSNM